MLTCEHCHEREVAVLLTSRIPGDLECHGLCQACTDKAKLPGGGRVPGFVIDSFPARELMEEFEIARRSQGR